MIIAKKNFQFCNKSFNAIIAYLQNNPLNLGFLNWGRERFIMEARANGCLIDSCNDKSFSLYVQFWTK